MIAPVADVTPWVTCIEDFPVDTRSGDPVRIVAICGGGIEENGNHRPEAGRVAVRQAFPVLKNVAPISSVVEERESGSILGMDFETIPRAAWVTVAPTEAEREVFAGQAGELGVLTSGGMC